MQPTIPRRPCCVGLERSRCHPLAKRVSLSRDYCDFPTTTSIPVSVAYLHNMWFEPSQPNRKSENFVIGLGSKDSPSRARKKNGDELGFEVFQEHTPQIGSFPRIVPSVTTAALAPSSLPRQQLLLCLFVANVYPLNSDLDGRIREQISPKERGGKRELASRATLTQSESTAASEEPFWSPATR